MVEIKKQVSHFNYQSRNSILNQRTWIEHADTLTGMHADLHHELDALQRREKKLSTGHMNKIAELEREP